jgi:hypothetical protein
MLADKASADVTVTPTKTKALLHRSREGPLIDPFIWLT